MREILVEELAAWRTSGKDFTLLDVREDHEISVASIIGAHHISMGEIAARAHELSKDKEIVVMCHHGGRSERVATFLESQGFSDAINLAGGIDAWSERIDPTVPRY